MVIQCRLGLYVNRSGFITPTFTHAQTISKLAFPGRFFFLTN